MLITNNTYPLNVLVARPIQKARDLTANLNKEGIACVTQPLFDYQPLADDMQSRELLTSTDIVIFVSVAAVKFAHANLAATHWQYQHVIAVGKATKAALVALDIENIHCPSQENSEGMLALNVLNEHLSNTNITIIRGNGGREHLATELVKRGAKVNYLESYQRVWRTFPKDIEKQWYQQQINCIVVTSNALLEKLIQLTQATNEADDSVITKHWKHHCIWLVASKRIADKAIQLGLTNVIQSDGANDQAISITLQKIMINK